MLFKQKFRYAALIGMLAIFGMLCMTSISFAQDNAWTTKTDMPTARSGHSTCVVKGKIYVIGGVEDAESTTISIVEEYDPATDTWITKSSNMQTPRSWLATCAVNGKIYAIGGGQSVYGVGFSTVEEYDPEADSWTNKAVMPTARFVLSASVVNGKIYVIGGKPGHGIAPLSTVEEYNPTTDTWAIKANMETPRFGLTTCVVNGKIYAIGGTPAVDAPYPGVSTVEEYDPVTDTWTTKTGMPTERGYLSAAAVNGKIYAMGGGKTLGSGLSTVEEYDPETNSWTTKTRMPTERYLLSISTVNDKIYAIGGSVSSWPWPACSKLEEYDPLFDQPTSIGNPSWTQNPTKFLLHQNYPYPFYPETRISYNISKHAHVTFKIINFLGQEVRTLANEYKNAGFHEVTWDGKNEKGQRVSGGIYLYRLKSIGFVQTRKMLLLQ